MDSSPPSSRNSPDGTRVDLGEDLLEQSSAPVQETVPRKPGVPAASAHDELDSARILLSEGLLEDARKALFRVLRQDPGNAVARMLLEDIRAQELKALLEPHTSSNSLVQSSLKSALTQLPDAGEVDPEQALKKLDQDLGLGLLPGPEETRQCEAWIRKALPRKAGARERMDWAVALIVLEQPALAVKVLEQAHQGKESFEFQALMAESCLIAGKYEECRAIAEQALRDPELDSVLRTEFTYLRARSLESAGRRSEAIAIFRVLGQHRDAHSRAGRS